MKGHRNIMAAPKLIRQCKCCGLEFETINPQKLFCDRVHYLPCPICGKPVLKKDRDFTRPPKCCSKECTVEKNRRNLPIKKCEICGEEFKPKSGVATICEKEHHAPCVICGKDMIVTKMMWHDKIDTCSRACAKEKMRRFYQEKYGVDHPMQNSQVQANHRAAMKAKYGYEHALQVPELLQAAFDTNLERFGTKFACLRDECQSQSGQHISSNNLNMQSLLEHVGLDVTLEKPLEHRPFDLCIESQKVLIEIDPTYWHNAYDNHTHDPKGADYHVTKSKIAWRNGYRCVHVFDWDANEKIVNLFRPKTKIGARSCQIKEVDVSDCNEFLRKYHLQGTVRKQVYRYGLYYNNELVQIMTFGKPRYDKSADIELLRLCTSSGLYIVGGAQRLFKHALINNPDWKSIISYCDLAKFTGEVYLKLGMERVRTTPPQIVWSKGSDKISSTLLRQRGYDQLFKTSYGKGTSNEQLMIDNGWLPVYDCGQGVYIWRRNT